MKKQYILRLGLAFTLFYAAMDSLLHPQDWIGFVPSWIQGFGLTRGQFLTLHSVGQIILAVWLFIPWQRRLGASLIALDILAIILINGFSRSVFPVTFRDVGLLAIAVYLALPE